jgi:hypothetical protein
MSSDPYDRVDWSRVARPQSDGYDSSITLICAGEGNAVPPEETGPTCFDGAVRVRYVGDGCPYDPPMVNAPREHPNIARSCELVRNWPEGFRQIQMLIHTLHPLWDSTVAMHEGIGPLSSCSGAKEGLFGCIFATVENPLTLAEALVHEMAHNKLFGLGVPLEAAKRLIVNSPERLFESPVIRDRKRPMQAVFHATYTFTYMLALNAALYRRLSREEADFSANLLLMSSNLPAVERGLEIVGKSVETDDHGASFLRGYFKWAEEIASECGRSLEAHQVARMELEPACET